MKITRKRLTEIIREELSGLLEAEGEPKKGKRKGPSKPDVASSDAEPTRPDDSVPDGGTVKGPDAMPVPTTKSPNRGPDPSELDEPKAGPEGETDDPESPDEAGGEEQDAEDAVDQAGDAGEEPSGAVNDEVAGKTVQAVTVEPKSQVLPGAKEVVVAFNESTDALRILVTPTGQVKFFWRGQLHDLP